MRRRIGALTISQRPRRDLLAPLHTAFPDDDIIEIGALDAVDTSTLPDGSDAYYPLTTTLNNGELVTLDRDFLASLLQSALDELEAQGVEVSVLLCAGDFPHLVGEMPLVQPTHVGQRILGAMGIRNIAVISPMAIQNQPIADKWKTAGFEARVWTMPSDATPTEQADWINTQLEQYPNIACVVLDYVGYPTASIQTLQALVKKPLFELGHLAISAVATLFG